MQEGGLDLEENYCPMASISKLKLKCLRIYNRGLSDTEIMENYNKTTSYHNMMETQ